MTDEPVPLPDPPAGHPVEIARALERLHHWWREPIAGFISLGIGVFDTWHFGRDSGLSSSLDEFLVVGGVVLIAGSPRLFSSAQWMHTPVPPPRGGKQP